MFETFGGKKEKGAGPEVMEALEELITNIAGESSIAVTDEEARTIAVLVAEYFVKQGSPLTEESVSDPAVATKLKTVMVARKNSGPVETYTIDDHGNVVGTNLSQAAKARLAEERDGDTANAHFE